MQAPGAEMEFLPPVERTPHSLAFEIIQEAGCVLFSFLHCLLLKPTCYITPQLCLGKVGFEFVPPVGSDSGFYINGSATSETFVFSDVTV